MNARSITAALVVLAACSSTDPPARPSFDDAGPPAALPDAGATPDGSAADARAPFDPDDEPVTCGASPCAVEVVAGDRHFCARISDGTVRCWGADEHGQLGRGAPPDGGAPTDAGAAKPSVIGLANVTQLSAAAATSCARTADGSVFCWGANDHGELGRTVDGSIDTDPHAVPARVAIEAASRVDVGQGSACATTAAGAAICWGNDESAQLARGEPSGSALPPARAELGVVVKRTAGGIDTSFALDASGTLLTWGAVAGPQGILSGRISSVTPTPLPSAVHDLGAVTTFAVSGTSPGRPRPNSLPGDPPPPPNQHACAITTSGSVYCWGKSERGALGSGLPDANVPLPTIARITSSAYPQQIAANGETTCVRMTDGSVLCTGENERGQLGTGSAGPFSSTFTGAITLSGRAVRVAVARETVCALLQDGAVACWGANEHGELGLGTIDEDPHPSATKVPL